MEWGLEAVRCPRGPCLPALICIHFQSLDVLTGTPQRGQKMLCTLCRLEMPQGAWVTWTLWGPEGHRDLSGVVEAGDEPF